MSLTTPVESPNIEGSASPSQHDKVITILDQVKGEIMSVLGKETSYLEKIQQLEFDLGAYKRAYGGMETERKKLEQLKQEAEKQTEDLQIQLKGHRILILLDGDGAIFSSSIIAQGQAGGYKAAEMLSDSILQYLSTNHGPNQYQLLVYVFFNKRGLMDTFGRVGITAAKAKFEDFIVGFNQAAERFLMIDVGSAKEAADAKIKALLEDIRLPQTEKVIFGGCHDNGYVTTLRSYLTSGFREKIILLRSYTEIAAGISDLELPILTIPDLFISHKLGNSLPAQSIDNVEPPTSLVVPPLPVTPHLTILPPVINESVSSVPDQGFDALPFSAVEPEPEVLTFKRRSTLPISYSSAVRAPKRTPTPDLDSSGSTASSDEADEVLPDARIAPTFTRSRHVNPNIPLSKHKPPPCTLFYLTNCKHGAKCKYAHDYLLEPEHFNEIRANAKKAPCPAINKGDACLWGEECCYGHKCPLTTKCHYFKQGRCKFTGADMHREVKESVML